MARFRQTGCFASLLPRFDGSLEYEGLRKEAELQGRENLFDRARKDKLASELKKVTDKWKKYLVAQQIATLVLSLAEFIIAANAIKFKFEMQSAPPLVRLHEARPGERRTVSVQLTMDTAEQADKINCMAFILTFVGIEFEIPNNGAVKKAGVNWVLVKGGGLPSGSEKIVQWVGGNPSEKYTDDDGFSRIDLEGAPRKTSVSDKAYPIMKEATVRAKVQLKPADLFRDISDALKGPAALPGELLQRVRVLSADYTFLVKDWGEAFIFDNAKYQADFISRGTGLNAGNETLTWSEEFYGLICGDPTAPATEWKIGGRQIMKQDGQLINDSGLIRYNAPRGYLAGSPEEAEAREQYRQSMRQLPPEARQAGGAGIKVFSFDPGPPAKVIVWIYSPNSRPEEQIITVPAQPISAQEVGCKLP